MAVYPQRIHGRGRVMMPTVDVACGQRQPPRLPAQPHEVGQPLERRPASRQQILGFDAQNRDVVDLAGKLQPKQVDLRPPEQALLVRTELLPAFRVVGLEDAGILWTQRGQFRVGVVPGATGV
jgi:hypothetical protein